jgi:hypothetical protein
VKRVGALSYLARQAWFGRKDGPTPLATYFPKAMGEQRLRHEIQAVNPFTGQKTKLVFSGRFDFASLVTEQGEKQPSLLMLGDWKTGVRQPLAKAIGPLKCYAMLAFAQYKTLKRVNIVIVWLADGGWESAAFTREEIQEWARKFIKYSAFWDGRTFSPGTQCTYCGRALSCPARREMVRSAVVPFIDSRFDPKSILVTETGELRPAPEIIVAYQNALLAKRAAEAFMGVVEEQVLLGTDIEDIVSGWALRRVMGKGADEIIPAVAWPILQDRLKPEELAQVVKVKKGVLETIIKQQAEKGKGAAAVRALYASLKAANAILVGGETMSVKLVDTTGEEEVQGDADDAGSGGTE